MKFIRSVPMATGGLSLALAALGNLLPPLPHGEMLRYICGVLSLAILIMLILKIVLDWPHAREELKTPLPLSVLPTATMAMMLLCIYARPYIGILAIGIWYAALIAHAGIMLLFFKRFVVNFKLGTVFPSWFIVGVGIAATSATAPAMGAVTVGRVAFYIGFAAYFAIFPIVVLRMNKVRVFPEPARPTIAIFAAPMSLLAVGYFSSFVPQGQFNAALIYIMLAIAAASYIYVTFMMISLLKIKFYPTYAAFTFPYVISAAAFRLGANFLAGRHGLDFLIIIADITIWIAVAAVVFVLVHYIRFFRFWLKF